MPGNKVVYVKNTDYVPRKEPPSWASGGKVVKVDRVEWIYIPDSATAAAALNAGEVDWWEQMPPDLIPLLAKNKDIKVENIDPLGSMGLIRFNFLLSAVQQPEDAPGAALCGQPAGLRALASPAIRRTAHPCYSYFTCGTPLASEVGAEPLKGKRDLEKAQAADQGSRLQGREDRHHRRDRSADRPFAIAVDARNA